MSRPSSSLLRHGEDVRAIGFVALYGVLAMTGWFFAPRNWLVLALWVTATALSSFIVAVITHNTIHSPVFHDRRLNRLFQIWLSLSYGFPVSEFLPGHNLSHHRYTQKGADLMRTTRVRYRWNWLNALVFVPSVAFSVTLANFEFASKMGHLKPTWLRQLRFEIAAVWGVKLALLLIDPRKAILFVFIPHLFAVWAITAVNYVQHDGCDEDHPYNHSRNFVGRAFNWVMFNNGFHGAHHMQPGLHWTLLPAAHAEKLHASIHPALEQPSLAVYLFKTFVSPGRRITYTGEPFLPVDPPTVSFMDPGAMSEAKVLLES